MHRMLIAAIMGSAGAALIGWLVFDASAVAAGVVFSMQTIGIIYGWVVRGYAEGEH